LIYKDFKFAVEYYRYAKRRYHVDPKLRKAINKLWPKTKIELEKARKATKVLIDRGEVHIKKASKTSAREIKKLSLTLQKEKLYFTLGKSVVATARSQWAKNKRISSIIKEIKSAERRIKAIK